MSTTVLTTLSLSALADAASLELGQTPQARKFFHELAKVGGNIRAGLQATRVPFGFADFAGGTKSSTQIIPAGAVVSFVFVNVTITFSGGSTLAVGQAGTPTLLMATTDNDLTLAPGVQGGPSDVGWGATARAALLTFGGSPVAGAGDALILWSIPTA